VTYDFQNERIAALDLGYRKIAQEFGVPYLPVFDRLIDHEGWQTALAAGDGVHPAGVGYAAVARHVMQWEAWKAWLS
jgi:acyl-CoA thioesterase-1